MGIVDRLYLVLVRRTVHYEGAWAARTGRATVLAKESARLNEVDNRISSAQQQIRQKQEVIHLVRPQQQRPASARREPTLVDPLAARGTSIVGEQRQQQPEQQQPQQLRGEELEYAQAEERRSGRGEREQAEELGGEQISRSDDTSAEDGQGPEALPLPQAIERSSPIEPVCWVRPGVQEQVSSPARHVETEPAVARVLP